MPMDQYISAVQAASQQTSEFNAQQAQINRDWQEYMSSTAHRREMADLEAAGLNPILAARQGASTPSGAQASGDSATGAIAGLLGQVLATNSAQAIADKNNAAAKLLEEMRELHDVDMAQRFPNNPYGALAAVLDRFLNGSETDKKGYFAAAKWYAEQGWEKIKDFATPAALRAFNERYSHTGKF